jgi:hypothetical protein
MPRPPGSHCQDFGFPTSLEGSIPPFGGFHSSSAAPNANEKSIIGRESNQRGIQSQKAPLLSSKEKVAPSFTKTPSCCRSEEVPSQKKAQKAQK